MNKRLLSSTCLALVACADPVDPDAPSGAVDPIAVSSTGGARLALGALGTIEHDGDGPMASATALAVFELTADDLRFRKQAVDAAGNHHRRYRQVVDGLDVIGGDLVVHSDRDDRIYAINGTARGDLRDEVSSRDIGAGAATARVTGDSRYQGMTLSPPRSVYLVTPDGPVYLAYELVIEGERDQDPVLDAVYVDADSGDIVAVHPRIHFAKNRRVHTASFGMSLPGVLVRSEGGWATSSDAIAQAAYLNTGDTYDLYKLFWNRDSYDNTGGTITSTVHFGNNYCNMFWNGAQLVFGDGDNTSSCLPFAHGLDATAHEFTHAVTQHESGLSYSGESGALNEAISDIIGATVEAYVDGGRTGSLAVSADTWKIGEDVMAPAIRYLNDPALDGASKDHWYGAVGWVDPHHGSGIANLAFYLMAQGGGHPRRAGGPVVVGIGMNKAARLFYKINTDWLTPSSNFGAARAASLQAAIELGFTPAEQASVDAAWAAVGVTTQFSSNMQFAGLADAALGNKYFSLLVPSGTTSATFTISGGTGDADLYVRHATAPSTTGYDCRPLLSGNSETCTFTAPQAGTYYVMIRGSTSYQGLTLVASYDAVPILTSGATVIRLSGPLSSQSYWKIHASAGVRTSITISGGSGDADLYTRAGAKPTTTTYACRPLLNGNNETCTVTNRSAGYQYIMLHGRAAYSAVTLTATQLPEL